jgi:hypothetical protein
VISLVLSACPVQAVYRPTAALVVAATDSGYYTYDGSSWASVEGPTESERSIAAASLASGNMRLTVSDSLLSIYVDGSLKQSFAPEAVAPDSSKLNAAIVDASRNVMAGTDKGLGILYGGASSFVGQLPSEASVYALCLDAAGYLYAASSDGLYRVGRQAELVYSGEAALAVYVDDSTGAIYVGTATGMRISANGGTSWSSSLPGHRVSALGRAP